MDSLSPTRFPPPNKIVSVSDAGRSVRSRPGALSSNSTNLAYETIILRSLSKDEKGWIYTDCGALTMVPLSSEGAKANGLNARALPAPGGGHGLFFVRCVHGDNLAKASPRVAFRSVGMRLSACAGACANYSRGYRPESKISAAD